MEVKPTIKIIVPRFWRIEKLYNPYLKKNSLKVKTYFSNGLWTSRVYEANYRHSNQCTMKRKITSWWFQPI